MAIYDDDEAVIEQIESYIENLKYLSYIKCFFSKKFYSHMLETDFDVYFLDIETADTSRIQLAEGIRLINQYALVIFMTGYLKYVTDVFEVNTFDFLLNPITFKN